MLIDDKIRQDGEKLIEDISIALDRNDFTKSEEQLSLLQTMAEQMPQYRLWYTYWQGVLIFKKDRDYAQAEQIWSDLYALPLEPRLKAKVQIALGNIYQRQKQWQQAIEIYQSCVTISESLNQPSDKVTALRNIGNTCGRGFDQGDFGQKELQIGIKACLDGVQALDTDLEASPDKYGPLYDILGTLHRNLEQWEQAGNYYQRCLAISQEYNHQLDVGYANGNLGEIYQKQGNLQAALDAYHNALDIFQKLQENPEIPEVLANLAHLYEQTGQMEEALRYHEKTIEAIEELRSQIPSEQYRMAYMSIAQHYYANAMLSALDIADTAQAFHYAERARSREFLDMLDLAHDSTQGIALPLTLEQVQKRLPADTLLLSYFTTGHYNNRLHRESRRKGIQRYRFPDSKITLFVITKNSFDVHKLDIPPSQFDGASHKTWEILKDISVRDRMYEQLLQHAEEKFQAKQQIYIIPHGLLHHIPLFAIIPQRLTAALPPITYGLSASILLQNRSQQPVTEELKSCLALGYNDTGENQLVLAEQEAQWVATTLEGHCWHGTMPKKNMLFRLAHSYQVLHFACHGEFDQTSPLESMLFLSPTETLTAAEVRERLRIPDCKVVILSSCESGRHQTERGDELLGFIRAFLHAGAQNVIATLWKVSDCPTLILMERFYQNFQANMSVNAALADAQHYLRTLTSAQIQTILQRWLDSSTTTLETISAIREAKDVFEQEDSDNPIFSDPRHWAPFIIFQAQAT